MPVELKNLPEPVTLPIPPLKLHWLVFTILCIFTGFILTLYFWPKETSTHTLWFWMCALLIPAAIGVICYAFKLRHYEQQWEHASYWNQLYEVQRNHMIHRGQEALGLLGMAYTTPAANNMLATALLQGAAPLRSLFYPGSSSVFTMAPLQPVAKTNTRAEYLIRLEDHLKRVLNALTPELEKYATNEKISIRFRHDGALEDAQLLNLWQRIFPGKYTTAMIVFGHQDNGLMWLDNWLDEQDSALILSLEINLFTKGANYQTESVSALLFASPTWLTHQTIPPLAWIHRPVSIITTKDSLDDVLRWGKLSTDEKYFIWRSQLATEHQAEILQAMDAEKYLFNKDNEHQLDNSLGHPAAAVGHITLICACEHAVSTKQPQWIMLQDKTPQWAIVRPA